MEVTETAMNIIKQDVKADSGLAEGVRLSQGSGCCGPAYELGVVKQAHTNDFHQLIEGINFYIDSAFTKIQDKIILDFQDGFFLIKGLADSSDLEE